MQLTLLHPALVCRVLTHLAFLPGPAISAQMAILTHLVALLDLPVDMALAVKSPTTDKTLTPSPTDMPLTPTMDKTHTPPMDMLPTPPTDMPPMPAMPKLLMHPRTWLRVTDYLLKRGFTKTEHVFRQESKNLGPDGRPVPGIVLDQGPKRYLKAFYLLKDFVGNNLEIYKFELTKLLWPVFVYSWLELVKAGYTDPAKEFLTELRSHFEPAHIDDLRLFSTITLPEHVRDNSTTRLYAENRYNIPLNLNICSDLFHFLERHSDQGGAVIRHILEQCCTVQAMERGPVDTFSFEAIYRRAMNMDIEEADVVEGVGGIFTGLANRDLLNTTAPLRLGPLPMEPDLREDVRDELALEDRRNPPPGGRPTLVDEFDRMIKREESTDGPDRAELPLPQSRARDVLIEVQKVRENRDRFKIEGRTGGVGGIPVSAVMYTFHNTLGSVSCLDMSRDCELAAFGTSDSYIRVYSLTGMPLKSILPQDEGHKFNNRKLIGHSGPVFDVSFSDAISNPGIRPFSEESRDNAPPGTHAKLLLSCSADGTIRLWSLETWTCLCVYKGHEGSVFRVVWGPHGHYFLTCGWDKTVRVWMQDHVSAQRVLVGHETSVSAVAWHPNGTYVFSASDETDKSIRMWSVITGKCVRIFTGHTDHITALECAPNGRLLASADVSGTISFWDLENGKRIKRSRGHGKGGVWSLSFSVESNVLLSGGQDGTVRLWDVELPAAAAAAQPHVGSGQDGADGGGSAAGGGGGIAGVAGAGAAGATTAGVAGGGGKKKGKEAMITPDQISAFPTKKTPVMKVAFTRMNLAVVSGFYDG